MEPASLSGRQLLGFDRSAGPPRATLAGQPLRPWTVPNAIGFLRIALIPVFLVVALSSADGRSLVAALIYAVIAGFDYIDGIVARLSGQYSRLGALLDPLTDRLLVLCGVVVTWRFGLLPHIALAILAARELVMLALSRLALKRGLDIRINMVGRWAVWPTMISIFLAMLAATWVAGALLWIGVATACMASALYVRDGLRSVGRPSGRG